MTSGIMIIITSLIAISIPIIISTLMSRGKKTSNSEWVVGGRDLPLFVVVGTQFATALGGGVLVAVVGTGYSSGLSAMTYGLVGASPFFIMLLIAPWIRANNFTTIPEILTHFYGEHKGMTVLAAFLALVVPFGWVTSQLGSFGLLYSQLTGLSTVQLSIGVSVVSLFLIMPSGLKTVAWTDFILSCLMVVIGGFVLSFAFGLGGGATAVFTSPNIPAEIMSVPSGFWAVGGSTVALWFMSSIPGGATNQIYYQRICAIKNPKRVTISLILSGITVYLTAMWAATLGITIRSINPDLASGQDATGWLMTQMPTWLLIMFGCLICSAIMSTISSAAQTVVANIINDIYPNITSKKKSDSEMVSLSRILAVAILTLACVLSILFPVVLNWLVYTYAFSAAGLLAPMFIGYFTRGKKKFSANSIVASMIVAMVVCIIANLTSSFGTPIPFTVYGVIASAVTMFVAEAFNKTPAAK